MKIAASHRGIVSQLGKIWETENETSWLRAGLVFALVDIALDRGDVKSRAEAFIGITKLGIRGLGTATAVRSYHEVWEKAIELGIATAVTSGSELKAPTDTFDKYWQTTPHAKAAARKRAQAKGKLVGDKASTSIDTAADAHIKSESNRPKPNTPLQKAQRATEDVSAAVRFIKNATKLLADAELTEETKFEVARATQAVQAALLALSQTLYESA